MQPVAQRPFEPKRRDDDIHIFEYRAENSNDAILMTDADFKIMYANYACNQLVGGNATGQSLTSIWFEPDRPLLKRIIEHATVGGFFSAARLPEFYDVIDRFPQIEVVGTLAAD